ncbi:MAG TPA: class I SAM-dependent methyltransferase [Candidatus Saccharimonadales bacterium]|nr:class I SAM-dependent methyltransferase [Candidatus Saccharimonadales bacterium]
MFSYNPPRYLFRRYTLLRLLKVGHNFLEIGAGNLKLSQELAKHFDNGLLIDFEPGVKEIFNRLPPKTKGKLSLEIGDFHKSRFNKKFDCVVACEVMEHIEDDKNFLAQIYKVLNKNGQLIISVPARQKYWTIHDDVVGHIRRYEKNQLSELARQCGFSNVRVYAYGFPFVNVLRLLRAMHGKKQYKVKSSWSKSKQTQKSGIGQIPAKYNITGLLLNKYTFYLPNLISRFFDRFDLSEAYILVAKK